ncbi:MAG: AMP-binding protein [Planctomycetota bacterium]
MDSAKLTVLDLLERSTAKAPDRSAIVTFEKTISYRELAVRSQALGRVLLKETARPVVALFFPTSPEFALAYLGVLYAGKQALPLNLLLPPAELKYIVDDSGTDLIIAPPELAPRLASLGVKVANFAELCAKDSNDAPPRPDPDDVCTLLYTSGTTGQPKGVELTHWSLAFDASSSVEMMQLDSGHRFLASLPSFHTFAITATMLAPLASGGSFATLPKFDPEAVLKVASELKCNTFMMVPSMYRLITRMQERRPREINLRLAIAGGEALPAEVREHFEKVFGIPLLEGYGQTETGPIISFNTAQANRPGTVGKPIPGVEAQIVDPDTLLVLAPQTTGEIWVRGPNLMKGYHHRPEETAKVLSPEGWLKTGDMGELTSDGFIRITGRLREMIKVSGEMVFPAEVENALLNHPSVFEAGVTGAKDERKGEMVKAYVVLKPGIQVTEDELLAHCRNTLAAYKSPRSIEFRTELPKGPTGKVLRRFLK